MCPPVLWYFSLILLLAIVPSMLAIAGIYKWTDEAGNVHYADSPQSPSAGTLEIKPSPKTEQIEKAKQRQKVLRNAAEDLQSSRLQREARQQKIEKQTRKQQQIEEQQTQDKKLEKEKDQREGNSKGHYQKQWQQQMPPQRRLGNH